VEYAFIFDGTGVAWDARVYGVDESCCIELEGLERKIGGKRTFISWRFDLIACEAPIEPGGRFEGTEIDEMVTGEG